MSRRRMFLKPVEARSEWGEAVFTRRRARTSESREGREL